MSQHNPESYPPVEDEPTRENPRLAEQLKVMVKQDHAWADYKGYGEEYTRENAVRTKDGKVKVYSYPEATLVASIRVDEAGQSISGHEHNPEANSHKDLEAAFQDYLAKTPPEQRILIYEGSSASYADRDTAIAERADAGLAMFMADKAGAEKTPGEPGDVEVADEMERQGVERAEMVLFTTLRAMGPALLAEGGENIDLAQLVHHQLARNGIPGFREYSQEEKTEISKDPARKEAVLADMSSRAVEYAVRELNPRLVELGLPPFRGDGTTKLHYDVEDPTQLVNVTGPVSPGRMGEIGRRVTEYRDRHIFNVITGAVADGKKPFVPYGGSHVVALRPALDAYFGHQAEVSAPEDENSEKTTVSSEVSTQLAELSPWVGAADTLSQSRVMRNFLGMLMNSPNAPAEAQTINEALARLHQGAVDKKSLEGHVSAGTLPEGSSESYEQMASRIHESIQAALTALQASLDVLKQSPQYGRTAGELEGQVVSQIVQARGQ